MRQPDWPQMPVLQPSFGNSSLAWTGGPPRYKACGDPSYNILILCLPQVKCITRAASQVPAHILVHPDRPLRPSRWLPSFPGSPRPPIPVGSARQRTKAKVSDSEDQLALGLAKRTHTDPPHKLDLAGCPLDLSLSIKTGPDARAPKPLVSHEQIRPRVSTTQRSFLDSKPEASKDLCRTSGNAILYIAGSRRNCKTKQTWAPETNLAEI